MEGRKEGKKGKGKGTASGGTPSRGLATIILRCLYPPSAPNPVRYQSDFFCATYFICPTSNIENRHDNARGAALT